MHPTFWVGLDPLLIVSVVGVVSVKVKDDVDESIASIKRGLFCYEEISNSR